MKTALATLPGSEIVLGAGGERSADYQKPLLRVPNYGDIELDLGLVIMTIRAFRHEHNFDRPSVLKEMVDSWEIDPSAANGPDRLAPIFEVAAYDHPRFNYQVSIDDEVAFSAQARIRTLVQTLADLGGIDEVLHEDREALLVRAPAMDAARLEKLVTEAWTSLSD